MSRLRDADKSLHTALMLLDEKLKAIYPRWVSIQEALPDQNDGGLYICHIVCGDFGLWHDSGEERHWLKWLDDKPFTTVFVDGNHENFDRLYSNEFPVVDFHGGKAHQIRPSVYHLMLGYVFDFDGKKFFAFGGASSHDIEDGILDPADYKNMAEFKAAVRLWSGCCKSFRINHVSWWKQELPSQDELAFGLQTLIRNKNKVDYIISHCCPQEVASLCGFREPDVLTSWFNTVAHTVRFDRWFFGHYHDNRQVMGKFVMLYDKIERIL